MISFRTEHENNPNRLRILLIINIVLVLMCAAAFTASAFIVRADAANYDVQVEEDDWFSIDEDGEHIHVHLQNELDGYQWKYGLSSDRLHELRSFELPDEYMEQNENNEWNVHFVPVDGSKDGIVTVTFIYINGMDSSSIDTRHLYVHLKDGKMSLE